MFGDEGEHKICEVSPMVSDGGNRLSQWSVITNHL